MSYNTNRVSEQEIHAYIDGQLDLRRIAVVEQYLKNNPAESKLVDEYQLINRLLLQVHRQDILLPVPVKLKNIQIRKKMYLNMWVNPIRIVATLTWLVVGATAGWLSHSASEQQMLQRQHVVMQNISRQAAYAHVVYTPEKRHPVEVDATNEKHLFKWLSSRLKNNVTAPPLHKHGYELIGGRLLPGEGESAAQFMYENVGGNRLTLYVRSHVVENGDTLFRYASYDDVSVFYWIDGPVGYALSGSIEKPELLDIANTVHESLVR